jgi:hypothetical protein
MQVRVHSARAQLNGAQLNAGWPGQIVWAAQPQEVFENGYVLQDSTFLTQPLVALRPGYVSRIRDTPRDWRRQKAERRRQKTVVGGRVNFCCSIMPMQFSALAVGLFAPIG